MRECKELLRLLKGGGESRIYLAEVLSEEPLFIVINGVRMEAERKAEGLLPASGDEVLVLRAGDELILLAKVVDA